MKKGRLYGVSVGPGDPELMTLKAVRTIRGADVIAFPGKEKGTCTAYQIARQTVPEIEEKECLPIPMPMTKDKERLEQSHREGAAKLLACLKEGKDVAFLTLGDVTIYSTGWYLYHLVREAGGTGELISGVPSFCAAAARLERALVSGEEALHVLPASYPVADGLEMTGVKVLMKAGKKIGDVKEALLAQGLTACGVQRCGMEGEKVYRTAEEIEEDAGYYSLFIVDP